ncbi:meiotic recombination [Malassezia sp. CBS 17886]|nr:meiotic recombination [Malassezia sp. CBS 17886]
MRDDRSGASGRSAGGAGAGDAGHVRFLLMSDTHLGYLERDPVRGEDSFCAFEEALQRAQELDVDFILHAGDLFHDNKPSHATMHRTMSLLREYTFGDRPVSMELLSDPFAEQTKGVQYVAARAADASFPAVNYEDENLNVSIPFFVIHGNHDDPQGASSRGALSALDLMSVAGLVNYFGRVDLQAGDAGSKRKSGGDESTVNIRPVLLQKGDTKVALYGMGNLKDERLFHELQANHVRMYRPAEDPGAWFNVLAVHQNRSRHSPRAHVPESAFDDSLHLVVWGHEHEQRIEPESVAEKDYYISQPGSTVATSLSPGEAVPKSVALVHVHGQDFKVDPIPLRTPRPFVMKDIVLSAEATAHQVDLGDRVAVSGLLRRQRSSSPPSQTRLPLVRLRVAYDDQIALGNIARFGQQFAGQVANPSDVLQLQLRRGRRDRRETNPARFDPAMAPAEKLDRVQLSSLVMDNVRMQSFDLLDANQLQQSVLQYVEKDDRYAVESFLDKSLRSLEAQIVSTQLDESQIQIQLERAKHQQTAQSAAPRGDTPLSSEPPSQDSMMAMGRGGTSRRDYAGAASTSIAGTARPGWGRIRRISPVVARRRVGHAGPSHSPEARPACA